MKTAVYVLLGLIAWDISNYGHLVTQHAIDTVGTTGSLDEFELGQRIYLIAGLIAIMFFFVVAMRLINKIWR